MGLKKWPPTFSQTWAGAEKTKTFQIADLTKTIHAKKDENLVYNNL